jgi:hypothetical protein
MRLEKRFNENRELFLERFPESYFFLSSLTVRAPKKLDLQAMHLWASCLDINAIDLLYVYGVADGAAYLALKNWLEEKKERQLVFLHQNPTPEEMASFLTTSWAKESLSHPRVHFFLYEKHRKEELFEEMVKKFPLTRIDLVSPFSHEKSFIDEMKLELFRKTTLAEALFYDSLFSHRHFSNFFHNVHQIGQSSLVNRMRNRFLKIPAIICGAGPSLHQVTSLLPFAAKRAMIFAGGSAIAALSSQGVLPHIGLAIDPNGEEYLRMKASCAFERPFFFATRLFHESFSTFNAPMGYLRSAIGGLEELWMDERISIQKEGIVGEKLSLESLSITTIAISLARFLGCDPIILCGVDLAYSGNSRYAEGVVVDRRVFRENIEEKKVVAERIFERKNLKGQRIFTSTKWIMEASALSSYAKEYPKTRFFNASLGGLPIKEIPFISLEELLQKELMKNFDIESILHSEMERTKFSFSTQKKIKRFCKDLQKSFLRCHGHLLTICQELEKIEREGVEGRESFETHRTLLAEMDLQEEDAFLYFLSDLPKTLENLLERKYPNSGKDPLSLVSFQRRKEKWEHMLFSTNEHLAVFQQKAYFLKR